MNIKRFVDFIKRLIGKVFSDPQEIREGLASALKVIAAIELLAPDKLQDDIAKAKAVIQKLQTAAELID